MTSTQGRFPLAPSRFSFLRSGGSGAWVSELLPNVQRVVDKMAIIKTMSTESINTTWPLTSSRQTTTPASAATSIGPATACYNVVDREVPLRDLHAPILRLFGLDPDRLRFMHTGLAERLIGVGAPARVVTDLIA